MPNKIAHESGLNQLFIYRYQLNKKFVHLGMNKEKVRLIHQKDNQAITLNLSHSEYFHINLSINEFITVTQTTIDHFP